MSAYILDPGRPTGCEPLTATRDLAECTVANQRLLDAQAAALSLAGLQPVLSGADDPIVEIDGRNLRIPQISGFTHHIFVLGDSWIDPRDTMMLARDKAICELRTADGELLAFRALEATPPGTGVCTASNNSRVIRYAWDLLEINAALVNGVGTATVRGDVSERATVNGLLSVGEGTRVLPGVYVEGNVLIGKDCKIGPNCYLRGPTAIGDGCHIGQAVEIKASIIMSNTNVGHLSYVGDSILGARVNFGAGTITANLRHDGGNQRSEVDGELVDTGRRKLGVICGDDVHTGIHTSLYPGRKLWPHASTLPGEVLSRDKHG
jgi:bifunctional UDP-N-acetylglucosamine pyrophosphorylase/glucosamine-1-phosphate N-acetyltransferase